MFPLCFCCRKGLHSAQPQLLADYMFFLQLNEMLRSPGEGHFWQVDHIKPVYEGGGQCSLDNLQTLCTVCHREVSDNHTCVLVQAALGGTCAHGWARLGKLAAPSGSRCEVLPDTGSVEAHSHGCGAAATLFIPSLRVRLSG